MCYTHCICYTYNLNVWHLHSADWKSSQSWANTVFLWIFRHHMVDQEDGEEFILDIVNEIVESTMKVLHEQYIISQTLPYTIQETKNLLLQIIEVYTHCRLFVSMAWLLLSSLSSHSVLTDRQGCNILFPSHPVSSYCSCNIPVALFFLLSFSLLPRSTITSCK